MRTKLVGWALAHRSDFESSRIRVSGIRLTCRGFTPTEILLVLFLLICLLIFLMIRDEPNRRRSYAFEIKQKVQFNTIDCALELFKSDFGYYPQSGAMDDEGQYYCGAMKLCEAMMGRDLQGFHPSSKFKSYGLDELSFSLYDPNTIEARKGPYLPVEAANAYRLKDLYKNVGPFDPYNYVLCDSYKHVKFSDKHKKIGMPILYYKADTSKTAHDVNDPNNPENIYDYRDNNALLALGIPGKTGQKHPLYEDPKIFYEITRNDRIPGPSVPNRADTYILLSAGLDGFYGTKDDITNFDFRWKR